MHHFFHLRRAAVLACAMLLSAATAFPTAAVQQAEKSDAAANDSPMLALTFDDGPSAKYTGRILDVLEANGAKATFFVIGRNIAPCADVLVRARKMGCEIGNHTYDHKKLSDLSGEGIARQLEKTDEAIEGILGIRPSLVRAPCGRCSAYVASCLDRPIILWSIDTRDWEYACSRRGGTPQNRDKIVRNVLEHARDGDIILMHDIYSLTADCVSQIVPKLCEMGFRLVTVSEMMESRRIELQGGTIYHNGR